MSDRKLKPTYFLTDEQIKAYQQWTTREKLEWIESTNEFLFHFRGKKAKELNARIRKGEI